MSANESRVDLQEAKSLLRQRRDSRDALVKRLIDTREKDGTLYTTRELAYRLGVSHGVVTGCLRRLGYTGRVRRGDKGGL